MKYALWITGIPACLAILCPKLVVVGYFFLIIPGVILTIAPTIFIYLVGIACVRRLISVSSSVHATMLSIAITLGISWAVMQPFRAVSLQAYSEACEPDIIPDHSIELHGQVLIEVPDSRQAPGCNYLCLAALDLPLVESVTMVTGGREGHRRKQDSVAYMLESAEANPVAGLYPNHAGQIVGDYRPMAKEIRGRKFLDAVQAVEADWAMRLTGPLRLRETEAISASEADWVIRIDELNQKAKKMLHRVTICDSTGVVRFRKSYLKQPVPASMFYLGFEAFTGGGTISSASFYVGRQFMSFGTGSLHPETELLNAIDFQTPECDKAIVERMRSAIEEVLNDPDASSARVDLARLYLGLFHFNASETDYGLIARIVSDDRVKNIDDQLMNLFSKKRTPTVMKDAYAERIVMEHTSAKLRTWLAESLVELPAGTFSDPSSVHLKIWNSPMAFQGAGAFLSRTADLDAERAIPLLLAALDDAIQIPVWHDRRALIEGVRCAFVELGPVTFRVTPQLRELFLRRPSPLMNNSGQADDWRFALARMGVKI